ncbi:MAG: OmpA family protein [Candidatus Latescibacterota bacterium]
MNKTKLLRLGIGVFLNTFVFSFSMVSNTLAESNNMGYSQSMEGGRGLFSMQSARTFGKGAYVIGLNALAMQREYPVSWTTVGLQTNKSTNYTTIIGLPVTIGLTDEVDLTAAAYYFHDARPYNNNLLYGKPESGIGTARLGFKIRFPFDMNCPVQVATKLGAFFDTSQQQIDGLDYRWTRKGTDIEASLLETFDLGKSVSLHLEQGYVLSGSKVYGDQYVGALGFDIHPTKNLMFGIEVNNRTFDNISPQTVFQALSHLDRYQNGTPNSGNYNYLGNPLNLDKNKLDLEYTQDYFVITPSVSWKVSSAVSLSVGGIINIADQVDPKEQFQIAAGITYSGVALSLLDSDKDGVNNKKDREPNTPGGYPVDQWGVALDTDKDGIPDAIDKQKNTPKGARVDRFGVGIDSDNDGVFDGIDNEANTPRGAIVDQYGVGVDSDGDGVPDGLDKEPNTLKGALVDKNGVSMDSDKDGVPDGVDREPNTPTGATVDRFGVSRDTDGDGVPDGLDLEPNSPMGVPVDMFGRAMKEQEKILVQEGFIRLNKVYFELGKAALTVESYDALNGVSELLKKYPMLKIEIQGHTDNSGSREKNLSLSQARAKAVLEYILKHEPELKRENFSVVGYGPDKPIAPNVTAEDRKLNRRVEFVVLNKEELLKLAPKK